jgi:microsomal dipeptidase-like Zn-dependent dipeptidase
VNKEFKDILKTYEKPATVKDLVDHIDHVVQVMGSIMSESEQILTVEVV